MDLLPIGTLIRFLDLIVGQDDDNLHLGLVVFAGKGEHGWIAGYTRSHRCLYMVENAYEEIFFVNSDNFEVISG